MKTRMFTRMIVTVCGAAVAFVTIACGSDTPVSPTSTATTAVTTQSVISELMVTGVAPASPNVSTARQSLAVSGAGFSQGVSLILKGPGTGATLYAPPDISGVTQSGFAASVTINVPGNWTATVRGADGKDSAEFPFVAHVTPLVTAVSAATHKNTAQTVTVIGANFLPGLSFVMKGPDTGAVKYSGADVTAVAGTSFHATAVLPVAGNWTITVINPDGFTTGEFAFVVK